MANHTIKALEDKKFADEIKSKDTQNEDIDKEAINPSQVVI